MNIKGNNTTLTGETTASIENSKLSKEIHDYVDNQVIYLKMADNHFELQNNILSDNIERLNEKIDKLNDEKLKTQLELVDLKICFGLFVIFSVALFSGLIIYLS